MGKTRSCLGVTTMRQCDLKIEMMSQKSRSCKFFKDCYDKLCIFDAQLMTTKGIPKFDSLRERDLLQVPHFFEGTLQPL